MSVSKAEPPAPPPAARLHIAVAGKVVEVEAAVELAVLERVALRVWSKVDAADAARGYGTTVGFQGERAELGDLREYVPDDARHPARSCP